PSTPSSPVASSVNGFNVFILYHLEPLDQEPMRIVIGPLHIPHIALRYDSPRRYRRRPGQRLHTHTAEPVRLQIGIQQDTIQRNPLADVAAHQTVYKSLLDL